MAPNNRPWVKAILEFPGLDFYIEGDAPLFNRRVNAVYLKLFGNNESFHGREHVTLRQHYIANRGNVLFRAIINLYVSGKHANFSTLYGAALTRLAEESGPSREWEDSSELGIDSVIFVVDRIIRARIQNLRDDNTDIDELNPVVEVFLATLDEWIAVLDERKMRAFTSSESTAPGGSQISLPYRPHPYNAATASASDAPTANQTNLPYRPRPYPEIELGNLKEAKPRTQDGRDQTIQDLQSQIKTEQAKSQELENRNIAHREEQETLELVNEALRAELDEAKNARRRIW
ncbi:uncharacterized protein CCOS01_09491 [Colletotrichum costaricense]|uniref:Uncharacterized protein n=1 Tax=Colletotrichum costaricense TaxID=1209916 RepID=A0AAI9YVD7_9PEZI|nr:uncharacterized protein CCOS01_09491 [Colletotrichum costaricense]KAK1524404.1 hypothetical protein CCOS01_09491 [Colletotrichum costaricense]